MDHIYIALYKGLSFTHTLIGTAAMQSATHPIVTKMQLLAVLPKDTTEGWSRI